MVLLTHWHITMSQLLLRCSDDEDRDNNEKPCDPIRDFYVLHTCHKGATLCFDQGHVVSAVSVVWYWLGATGALTTTETSTPTGHSVILTSLHKLHRTAGEL